MDARVHLCFHLSTRYSWDCLAFVNAHAPCRVGFGLGYCWRRLGMHGHSCTPNSSPPGMAGVRCGLWPTLVCLL